MLYGRADRGGAGLFAWLDAFMQLRDGVHVFIRGSRRLAPRALGVICALAAGILAGCSTSNGIGSLIVDPGHYSLYHCKDLGARLTSLLAHEQQLRELMDKAGEGGGVVVANLSYRADYEDTLGEEQVLRRAAAEKNCELPPPILPVATTATTTSALPAAPISSAQPAPSSPTSYRSDQTIH